jgi:polyisoprenoid-binding protein YceI
MKKLVLAAFLVAGFSYTMTSCSSAPEGDKTVVTEAQEVDSTAGTTIQLDSNSSKVGFVGNGVGKNHPGTFKVTSGSVTVAGGKITGGKFIINTKSMEMTEQGEMIQNKLKGHLMSPDFFDVEKYPTAIFEITGLEAYTPTGSDSSVIAGANYTVSGNLTLKDVTKNVSFPAKVDLTETSFKVLASFNIDRTLWGMKYGNDKSLKDKFISEIVNINLDLESR